MKSKHRKYCMMRAKRVGTQQKRGSPFEGNMKSQCNACDRGQHRRCERLAHCHAGKRSPNGVNRRELDRAAARARRQLRNGTRRPLPLAHERVAHELLPESARAGAKRAGANKTQSGDEEEDEKEGEDDVDVDAII